MDHQYCLQRNVETECKDVDNLSFITAYRDLFNLTTSVVDENFQRHALHVLSYLLPAFCIYYATTTNVLLL
jgi:hypothetical protein